MEDRLIYGILFTAEVLDEKNVLLRPYHLIEGNATTDGNIIDKYEKYYRRIHPSLNKEDYRNVFGFGILAQDLQTYFRERKYPKSQTDFSDVCANFYLEFAKRYVFILEHEEGIIDPKCYAVNLATKETRWIDISQNVMAQLMDDMLDTINRRKTSNETKEEKSCKSHDKLIYNPKKLLERIKRRVVGQDEAAFQLVSTVCKNLKYGHFEGMKSNILLYGPTGCGKTELVRSLAKELELPLVIDDVTTYTANGYVGDSVRNILKKLYIASGKDMSKAERGIVFLDEFDKLASPNSKETVNKTDVQEELLKMVEGGKFEINEGNKNADPLVMDTSNITFILGGAFDKLYQSKKKNKTVGFISDKEDESSLVEITNEDFVNYGIISEMVGRIQVKIPIRKLTIEDLKRLLVSSSISCLRIYESALLTEDNVRIVYDSKRNFISRVAEDAEKLNVGARGLKTIVDKTLLPAVSEIGEEGPNKRELFISSETVINPNAYVLKKIRRDSYELPKRVGEANR